MKKLALMVVLAMVLVLAAGCTVALPQGGATEHTHTLVHNEAKAPTCVNNGILEHWYCPECNGRFADEAATEVLTFADLEVEELGHIGGTATCTEQAVCERCEKAYGALLDHTYEAVVTPPTCTEEGYTTYTCSCSHSYVGDKVAASHTAGEDGNCTVCGYVLADTAEKLIAAMEAGKNVVLMNDLTFEASLKCPYGNAVGVAQKGGVLDGNGKTLTVTGSGNYYAIITYGGTIKNLTINDGFRGIVTYIPTEDVIIDNVIIAGDGICYGLNTAEHATMEGIDLIVTNSTIMGWSSFEGGFETATFENCKFVQGVYYDNVVGRLVKPYISTEFKNCEFVKNAYLDLSSLEAGATVVLTGCKIDGVDVTKDVFTTNEDDAEIPFTYEAPAGITLTVEEKDGAVSFHHPA